MRSIFNPMAPEWLKGQIKNSKIYRQKEEKEDMEKGGVMSGIVGEKEINLL